MQSLHAAARACLRAAAPDEKIELTFATAEAFGRGELAAVDDASPPEPVVMPGRPERPRLVHPRELSKRGLGSPQGRAAFIHSIAHIELNAIDLAWDAVYRFRGLPAAYYADWVGVAGDEARHFQLLRTRLRDFGHAYGDFDAHNGLWEMAGKTAHDGLARMALVPRVLEARGLDVTPGIIQRLTTVGDERTVAILEVILREEVAHVAAGTRWFHWCCARDGLEPRDTFIALLQRYFSGGLRGPFNHAARREAGFDAQEMDRLLELASG